jgi:hypothetical protein
VLFQILHREFRSDTIQPGGGTVAKLVLIKTAPNDTYINPDHVVCIEAVGTGSRITMTDGRDFTTAEDKESVAMHLSE